MREIWVGLALLVVVSSGVLSASSCKQDQFSCPNGKCLEAKQRCDHVTDCSDGADERGCDYVCKSPHMQQCRDGHCVAMYFFCDGRNDCGDWSDELNCTSVVNGPSSNCPSNTFRCVDGSCIPQSWVCDGMNDCPDGKEELHCDAKTCKNGFQCENKECILNQWVCDGVTDCADGSDEQECGPDGFLNHSCLPEHGWFSCLVKGANKCMPIRRACDSFTDCDDRSDEGGLCAGTQNCNTTTCSHGCKQTPKGPVCQCPLGFRVQDSSCVDIDECALSPPLCSQNCKNTQGSFECSCLTGYTLNKRNNRTCIATGPEMVVFITTDRDVRSMALPSHEYGLVQSGLLQAHSVTGDYEDGFVYWTEKSKDKAGIFRSLADGSALQYVVSIGVESVEDLALDWVGRHIYFTDSGRKHIVACDVHGTLCSIVLSGQLDQPRGLALYPEERLLFWSDWGSRPHIGVSGMDGSRRRNLITTDIVWPNGLAIDETTKRIFWSDPNLKRIESSLMDGSNRIILPVEVDHPYAIDVFENRIYWTDPVENEVQSCDKFTGKEHKVLMKEASLRPTGIHIHHPSKQTHMLNPCWNIICSHLCLLSPGQEGFQCACPIGMTLNANNRTCDSSSGIQPSIVIATYTDLYQVTHHLIGKDSLVRLPTRIMENIGALAFNPMGHSVIYSDLGRKVIYSIHLETFRESVLFENADMVEGLDVDPYTENIYWTEVAQGTLVVGHLGHDGSRERVVLSRDLHSPKSIALAPELGILFVVEGRSTHVINVCQMDGTGKRELVQVYGTVSSMSYDRKDLYFTDSLRGTIERISVDGKERAILRSHLGSPMAMDTSIDSIFWMTQMSSRISWMKKQEPKNTRGFVVDAGQEYIEQYRLMAVVTSFDFSDEHVCLGHTGGCSDICVPTPTQAKCLCPLGKELAADQHICRPINNCTGSDWFKCGSTCIQASFRCDGVRDCPAGEDELQCRNDTMEISCGPMQFQCKSGGCVAKAFVCDGDFDCQDRSDEPDTCEPPKCYSGEILCPNQRNCIPPAVLCDGQRDCADGWDEKNCTATSPSCSSNQFFCSDSRLCIPLSWVCDKDPDCAHGEDEKDSLCSTTGNKTCPINHIRCPTSRDCLPRSSLCSGVECLHARDEDLCLKLITTSPPEVSDCSVTEFNCYLGSNECVPAAAHCNCQFDCTFGEDEEGCQMCDRELFRCPGEMRYINMSWVCDGLPDCSSGEDELPSRCSSRSASFVTDTPRVEGDDSDDKGGSSSSSNMDDCSADEYQCASGQCIPFSLICDGEHNCADGTDEGSQCHTSCADNNGRCTHLCIPSPKGPVCECGPGYSSPDNGRTCLDLDECVSGNHRCSQYCNNTKGSYRCSCAGGYQMEPDQHTCKVVNGRPLMIVASSHAIDLLFNNGAEVRRLAHSPNATIKDIAYHDKMSTLYWLTASGVSRSSSDDGASLLFPLERLNPTGLALDRATGNLYVCGLLSTQDGQERSIIKVISKSSSANIITTPTVITDVAIDNRRGLMFWSEHVSVHSGRIIRSTMDGSSTLWFHTVTKLVYPIAITLDSIQGRIYWADLRLQSISSCDFNGQQQKQVVSNTNGLPISLSFFENRVSWANVEQKSIRSQVLDNHITGTHQLHERISHLLTVHSVLEPELSNPCSSSRCGSGFCILRNASAHSCHCSDGYAPVDGSNPLQCRWSNPSSPAPSTLAPNPDWEESRGTPGVTVASILICLAVLTILAVLGWVYYKRWRRTIGSPLKFRFRNALGMTQESTTWEESIDYSDRKMLYVKDDNDEPGVGPQVVVDQNDNRTIGSQQKDREAFGSAFGSQQSLNRTHQLQQQNRRDSITAGVHQPQQLLPVTHSMKDELLASEL